MEIGKIQGVPIKIIIFNFHYFLYLLFYSIMEIDASIGRVMQLLKIHQKDENTLVYFTSDHGSLVDVGLNGGSNGNFKGKICIIDTYGNGRVSIAKMNIFGNCTLMMEIFMEIFLAKTFS